LLSILGTINVVRKVNVKPNPTATARSPPITQYVEMSPQLTNNQPKSVISINLSKNKQQTDVSQKEA